MLCLALKRTQQNILLTSTRNSREGQSLDICPPIKVNTSHIRFHLIFIQVDHLILQPALFCWEGNVRNLVLSMSILCVTVIHTQIHLIQCKCALEHDTKITFYVYYAGEFDILSQCKHLSSLISIW